VVVPTSYYTVPTQVLRDTHVAAVIWANHNLRASITAMRDVSRSIRQEQSVHGVERSIASLEDVFALSGNAELEEAERYYLPKPPERDGGDT